MTDLPLVFASSWWLDPTNLLSMAKAAFGLGFVIFVHELGHFLVAKACGVKCEKFYIGFDVPMKIGPIQLPAALFRKQWGETEYGVGIIPLGGYVKMLGQDDNPSNAAKEAERIRQHQEDGHGSGLDPRSYPAKTVPQRMAIISAGVIMNLIFAVIFATIAYKMGVKYTPCVIGSTMPGDPAWLANLQTGDKIVQLGRDGQRSEQLRFTYDLRTKVFKTGAGNPCDILVRRLNGEEEWVTLQPRSPRSKQVSLPSIGVFGPRSTQIADPMIDIDTPAKAVGLVSGDRVASVDIDGVHREFTLGSELELFLSQHPRKTALLTVERTEEDGTVESRTVELPPRPIREVGFDVVAREIAAVQASSPSEQAGLKAGDQLIEVDGSPFDPLLLDTQLLDKIGTPVQLTIQRKGTSDKQVIELIPREPRNNPQLGPELSPVPLDSIGIALRLTNTVQHVDAGGPADKAGMIADDVIQSARFVAPAGDDKSIALLQQTKWDQYEDFTKPDAMIDWSVVFGGIQTMPPAVEVELILNRGGKLKTVKLQPVASADFNRDRGLIFKEMSEVRTASSFSEAIHLGVRETQEAISQVFFTLKKIKHLYRGLGGPGMIAYAATSEASAGIPRLLVFLTLLSANLAVLNFLPIPVLDGGHMMFLAYEGLVGKPVNERIAFGLTMVGLTFILGLMVFVIGMDVYRFGFSG